MLGLTPWRYTEPGRVVDVRKYQTSLKSSMSVAQQ